MHRFPNRAISFPKDTNMTGMHFNEIASNFAFFSETLAVQCHNRFEFCHVFL